MQIVTMDQRRKIDDLSTFVEKLSTTKDRQRQKLSCLKKELKMTEEDAGEHSSSLKLQLDSLTSDLKSNKMLLDEVNRREKQVPKLWLLIFVCNYLKNPHGFISLFNKLFSNLLNFQRTY